MSGALLVIALVLGLGAMEVWREKRLGMLSSSQGENESAIEDGSAASNQKLEDSPTKTSPSPSKNRVIANVESWSFSGDSPHGIESGFLKDLLLARGTALVAGERDLASVVSIEEAESVRREADLAQDMEIDSRQNSVIERGDELQFEDRFTMTLQPGSSGLIEIQLGDQVQSCRNGHTVVVIERSATDDAIKIHLIEATLTQ